MAAEDLPQLQHSQSQKLFRLPGTIEEEDCERELQQLHQRASRAESPLLAQRNNVTVLPSIPKNVTLLRVSTQSSSIAGIARQDSTRSRFRAGPARKLRRRAVLKSGECNVLQSRISRRSLRFLQDIFTTLVDTQWRWTLLCFALSFLLSWLIFAGIWWLIAFTHGDFDPRHMNNSNWRPCVNDLNSYTSCFLFSIETQHTIGYGGRSTTEECPEAIFVMCIQSISGVMIQAFMVGIVFAKMSRPKQRTQTLLFSKNAVICQRDGELCLMFRVGDMRKSHIIGAQVRAQLIRSRTTKEGEILPHNQQELVVGADGQTESLFFIWPCTVVHRFDAESPFYNMSAEDMLSERFEIVVILEGTIESTGQTTQARSSYLPQEVLWGHRFEPIVSYSKERQGYEVDYSLFNSTVQVDTPLCSGRELAEFYRLQDELRQQTSPGFLVDEELVPPIDTSAHRCKPYHQPHHQHHHHHQQQQRNRHQHRNEFSLEDTVPPGKCCLDCTAPPPYGPRAAAKSLELMDDEEVALLGNSNGKLCVARYPLGLDGSLQPSRSLGSSRRALCCSQGSVARSCQDLQPPASSLSASKKYLLLALEHASLCNSCPSEQFEGAVIARRHTGSKEGLSSLRASRRSLGPGSRKSSRPSSRERSRERGKTLQEIVVEKLDGEGTVQVKSNGTTRNRPRSYENAQLQDVNRVCAGSDGSYCAGSSSSESEPVVPGQLLPSQLPTFTSV